MEALAPAWAAAEWDNVGLLAGHRNWPLTRLLATIDLTPVVLEEAIKSKCDAILAYHPPIFRGVKRFIANIEDQEGLAAAALAARIALYSPHTALDAAPGGTNDTLAALAGLIELQPFTAAAPPARQCKMAVFVPPDCLDKVANALFAAGAGRIGDYEQCSYRLRGQGTFFGGEATDPAVGKKGRLEMVDEVRLEMVVPQARLAAAVAALRAAHPYEEPAFDVYPLADAPQTRTGQGRIGRWAKALTLGALAAHLKKKTATANAVIIGAAGQRVRRGYVCVGSAGTLPFEAADRCGPGDVVITGEIRHHDALRYHRAGVAAVALGHWASERPVLAPLCKRLESKLKGAAVRVSRADRDPFGAI